MYPCSVPGLVVWQKPTVKMSRLPGEGRDARLYANVIWKYSVECLGVCLEGDGPCRGSGNHEAWVYLYLNGDNTIQGPMTDAEARDVAHCMLFRQTMSPAECLRRYGGGAKAEEVITREGILGSKPDQQTFCTCNKIMIPTLLGQWDIDFEDAKKNEDRKEKFMKRLISKPRENSVLFTS